MADATSRWSWALLVALAGCDRCNGDDCEDGGCITYDPTTSTSTGADDDANDDVAPGSSDTATSEGGGSSSSTGVDDGQCQGTDECGEQFCVAPYADNVRGDFACVADCVGPSDESKWCFDDAACCDPAAHCTIRGYCEVEGATTGEGSGSSSDSSGSSSTG